MSKMLPIWMAAALIAAIAGASAEDDISERTCGLRTQCPPGSQVISFASEQDPYYACPTEELSNYTNTVLDLMQTRAPFGGGSLPLISPFTGQPQYKDTDMLTMLRTAAGVKTFDQAVQLCQQGRDKQSLHVMETPPLERSMSYLVTEEKTRMSFWMPRSHLDLVK